MNYRQVKIHAAETLGASGTKIIPINVKDPITRITIQGYVTVGVAPRLAPIVDALTKVEIVDGSDVIYELSGSEIVAASFYEGHKHISFHEWNIPSVASEFCVDLYFGRFIGDPLLAFDPTKFSNPMLRITWDCTKPSAAAAVIILEVDAYCFDEKIISPIGLLRTTQHQSYTGGVSTYEYVDLPTDLPIRKLYLQTKQYGVAVASVFEGAKLSEDNDKRVVFDMDAHDWKFKMSHEFGYCSQNWWAYPTGVGLGEWFPAPAEDMMVVGVTTMDMVAFMINETRGCRALALSADVTALLQGHAKGTIPYWVWCFPFGLQQEIDDWYDVTRVGSLRLRVKSGTVGTSTTYNTILQQLRRY